MLQVCLGCSFNWVVAVSLRELVWGFGNCYLCCVEGCGFSVGLVCYGYLVLAGVVIVLCEFGWFCLTCWLLVFELVGCCSSSGSLVAVCLGCLLGGCVQFLRLFAALLDGYLNCVLFCLVVRWWCLYGCVICVDCFWVTYVVYAWLPWCVLCCLWFVFSVCFVDLFDLNAHLLCCWLFDLLLLFIVRVGCLDICLLMHV